MRPSFTELCRSRAQAEGDFNADLPRDWLVATILDLLDLCAEEVDAGRLRHDEAGRVLTVTLLGPLACSHLAPHAGAHVRRSTPSEGPLTSSLLELADCWRGILV